MPVLFANPLGFWALLGVPAILLIHFLQRKSRRVPTSTLFLLDRLDRESVKGRRFDRLRQSIPLWLQLLGVLLLTWLLTEPRWKSGQSVQRIVLVLDNSASMEAFREELATALRRELPPLARESGTTEFTVLESSVSGSHLYRGTSVAELLAALPGWKPVTGAHSPEPALRVGRGLAGAGGTLIFATDHPGPALPFGTVRLAVGSPIENVGFAGLRVDESEQGPVWKATLKNYAATPQSREWFLMANGQRTETRKTDLAPGEARVLQGKFPEGVERISLILAPDRFSRDDRLDLVLPQPKPLTVSRTGSPRAEPLVSGIVASLAGVEEAGADGIAPDLWFSTYDPLRPAAPPAVGVVLLDQAQVPGRFLSGPLVPANHPLTEDLDWQGLIARITPSIPPAEGDTTLLWQGERSMIVLRETEGRRQLIFNFDVVSSNAPRLPAFVVLVHRFVERIREDKVAPESRNVELRQALTIAHLADADAPPLTVVDISGTATVPLSRSRLLRAPGDPGFFQVHQGGTPLLKAAANFADTREADFAEAGSVSELGPLPEAIREHQTRTDPARPFWVLVLCVLLIASWAASRGNSGNNP